MEYFKISVLNRLEMEAKFEQERREREFRERMKLGIGMDSKHFLGHPGIVPGSLDQAHWAELQRQYVAGTPPGNLPGMFPPGEDFEGYLIIVFVNCF